MYKFTEAKGIYKLFLTTFGYVAVVNPFTCTCHVLAKYLNNQRIINHEQVHFEQIARHGKCLFCVKYLYYLVRYGYKNNPFEVEAYQKEDKTSFVIFSKKTTK